MSGTIAEASGKVGRSHTGASEVTGEQKAQGESFQAPRT